MRFTRTFFLRPAALLLLAGLFSCGSSRKTRSSAGSAAVDSTGVHWMSMAEAEAAMKQQPKKVWIDVYTDWCGWCKVMDKKTFTNPEVIRYLNRYYYAVKLNAESHDSIRFQGTAYGTAPDGRNNELAVKLLNGQMGYPTSLVMDENFVHAYSFMGYQTVPQTESILKYFNEGWYNKVTWEQYTTQHPPTWRERATAEPSEQAGH